MISLAEPGQDHRKAFKLKISPMTAVMIAAPVSATTRSGEGCADSDHGGWPAAPGRAGSIKEGPSRATVTVSAKLTAVRVRPGPACALPVRHTLSGWLGAGSAVSALGGVRSRLPGLAGGERASDVGELMGPVQLGVQVLAGGPVRQRDRDLGDPHPLPQQVDGEAGLGAPAVGQRPGRLEGRPGQAALAVQRLGRPPAGHPLDASSGQAEHDAVAAALVPGGEDRDGHVGLAGQHRLGQRRRTGRGLGQVGVEEKQVTGRPVATGALPGLDDPDRFRAGLHGRGLAPVPGVPGYDRAGLGRLGAGAVVRAVVNHYD